MQFRNLKERVALTTMEDTRYLHCNIKTLNLLPSVMAAQKAAEEGCFETVFHRGDMEAISRVVTMIRKGKTTAITGKEIPIEADSVCVHGDGAKALIFVKKLRQAFAAEGILVQSLKG